MRSDQGVARKQKNEEIICKKCRDKKPGATHHVLCAGVYFKPDKKARESLLKELRAIATAAKQADAVPRPPRLPTHACLPLDFWAAAQIRRGYGLD